MLHGGSRTARRADGHGAGGRPVAWCRGSPGHAAHQSVLQQAATAAATTAAAAAAAVTAAAAATDSRVHLPMATPAYRRSEAAPLSRHHHRGRSPAPFRGWVGPLSVVSKSKEIHDLRFSKSNFFRPAGASQAGGT